ncbi:hypothetical protein HDF14_004045 [Edaphobacter lichenicola]|jgi:hypothetical protein|uniref:Uncharacterized protein n=1 Tax=Tunturiibacter gelidiferens TaxID=3069689 RepID=A0A9X0QHF4_9BACT|nr:hypothetical protein [Edaphobacter lichenicola]
MTDQSRRRALVFGKTVDFQSRNIHISTVRWHSRFKEEYASGRDVKIAVHAWLQCGKTFFAGEISDGTWLEDLNISAPLRKQSEIGSLERRKGTRAFVRTVRCPTKCMKFASKP